MGSDNGRELVFFLFKFCCDPHNESDRVNLSCLNKTCEKVNIFITMRHQTLNTSETIRRSYIETR